MDDDLSPVPTHPPALHPPPPSLDLPFVILYVLSRKEEGRMGQPALWVRVRPSARLRRVVVVSVLLLPLLWLLLARSGLHGAPGHFFSPPAPPPVGAASWERRNPSLSARECAVAFPGLTCEVERAVADGPFVLARPSSTLGPLIARIRDGKASPPPPLFFLICSFLVLHIHTHTHIYVLGALFPQGQAPLTIL